MRFFTNTPGDLLNSIVQNMQVCEPGIPSLGVANAADCNGEGGLAITLAGRNTLIEKDLDTKVGDQNGGCANYV